MEGVARMLPFRDGPTTEHREKFATRDEHALELRDDLGHVVEQHEREVTRDRVERMIRERQRPRARLRRARNISQFVDRNVDPDRTRAQVCEQCAVTARQIEHPSVR